MFENAYIFWCKFKFKNFVSSNLLTNRSVWFNRNFSQISPSDPLDLTILKGKPTIKIQSNDH